MFRTLLEIVRKDLAAALADRKAVIISFIVPIALGSFFAMLFRDAGSPDKKPNPTAVVVSDEDGSPFSRDVVERLRHEAGLKVAVEGHDAATAQVASGKIALAVFLPKGFGGIAEQSMRGGESARIDTMSDPAKQTDAMVAKGIVTGVVMGAVADKTYGVPAKGGAKRPDPVTMHELPAKSAPKGEDGGAVAHVFAGMAVQGLLFWSIESAMTILRERRLGIWRRLRAAPVRPLVFLFGRGLSGAVHALLVLLVVFGFGMAVFGIRVHGNPLGFALITVTAALMASAFGLFVAALGRTEAQSRGLSVLAVLSMSMLGGAWFPMSLMPGWVQSVSQFIPVRWAVDGLDAMTWRAQGFTEAAKIGGVLLVFTAAFASVAVARMRFDAE